MLLRTIVFLFLAFAFLALALPAAAAPCPEPGREGGTIRTSRTKLAAAHETQVIAGGEVALAACAGAPGDGRVPAAPQVNVILTGMAGPLEMRTAGDCDTVLLVSTETGWLFDDDGAGGTDARLRLDEASPGRYDVWVGTWGAGTCRARLILHMPG